MDILHSDSNRSSQTPVLFCCFCAALGSEKVPGQDNRNEQLIYYIIQDDAIDQIARPINDGAVYYAEMNGDRDMTLSYFAANGGVLVSIKCLDEGVDIPATTHALVLASSQNPREFIQRRGRILRKSPGKLFAHLFDAITVPVVEDAENDKSLSIITAELSRAIQFGANAENPACVTDLKNIAVDFNIEFTTLNTGGIEDDE